MPEPPPKKRSYAFLTPKEKEVANKKKHPHRQSAKEFLESKGQCASWIKWTESEKDLFTLLLPRFYRASGSDFASFASLWTDIHAKGGEFEGSSYTIALRDRVSLKNHYEHEQRKKCQAGENRPGTRALRHAALSPSPPNVEPSWTPPTISPTPTVPTSFVPMSSVSSSSHTPAQSSSIPLPSATPSPIPDSGKQGTPHS